MRYKIYIKGNIFYIEDADTDILYEGLSKEVIPRRKFVTSTDFAFTNLNNWDVSKEISFSDIDLTGADYTDLSTFIEWLENELGKYSPQVGGRIYVTQENYLKTLSNIDSSKEYYLDGVVNIGSFQIVVPQGGMTLSGYSFDISGLTSSEDNYTMFVSETPLIGSGNVLGTNYFVLVNGSNSKVHELYDYNGNNAIEYNKVNFINCTSLGELVGYRQYLENGTGRFGGTPELTFSETCNGARIDTSIVRGISNITSLFKTGTNLTFSGRFITDINCDLNTLGALFDFSDVNFTNDESLIIKGAFITRNGIIDTSDTTIHPNINEDNVKSLWSDNTGIPSTTKYIKGTVNTEVETVISVINTYYPLLGTFTIERQSHFDMPINGQFRLLSGNGTYQFDGDLIINGSQGNEIDIRITKSLDNGSTFPTQINHIKRVINNLAGGRDVAFFPLSFISSLKKNERIRIEVENKSGTSNVTAELDSYFIITKI